MKLINNANYIIYFDKTRVDRFTVSFDTNLGLTPTEATASVTMLNADSLAHWKAYLAEVRIFVQNAYTGRYRQVFTGDIVGVSDASSRAATGQITFQIKGLYSWLDIPVPVYVESMDNLNVLRRFQLQAQNIDVDAVSSLMQNRQKTQRTNQTIEQIVHGLFQLLDQGYTDITDDDTAFGFKDLLTKFKVMSDIDPKFRDKGFLDLMTFTQATTLQGFYDYLYTILTQMMMEFYQDRDGSLRIKGPSWNDAVPKAHILDESVVGDVSMGTTWDEQPTRVLAIGGKSEILESASKGDPIDGLGTSMSIPVGLYIYGGKYIGMHFESFLRDGVTALGGTGPVEGFYDDLSAKKVYPAATYLSKEYERLRINGGKPHYGTDYYMSFEPLYSQGVDGVVEENRVITGGGNTITIKQVINGHTYYLTYMHLNALPPFKKGDPIKAGQKIGTTGGSGIGPPHLHFQVWKGGFNWANQRALTIDPQKFLAEMASQQNASGSVLGTSTGMSLLGRKQYKGPDNTSSGYTRGVGKKLDTCSQFDSLLKSTCAKHGINPMMLKVMMVMESSGNPKAVGPRTIYGKAYGLLQIIPGAVDISVTAADLLDPAKHLDAACRVMKSKALIMKTKGLPQTVENGAHFWYGYLNSGLPYKKAFTEIYEGFPGLRRTDSLFQSKTGTTGTSAQNTLLGPRLSGPQAPRSLQMASRMVQALAAQPAPGGSTTRPATPSNPYSAGSGGTAGSGTPEPKTTQTGKPVNAPSGKNPQKYVLPSGYGWLSKTIQDNANGLDQNLVWAIIKATSNISSRTKKNDNQNLSPEDHYGLMGVPKSYMDQHGLTEAEMYIPSKNIYHGTKLYKECYAATKKHSFALLAYFLGGGGLKEIDNVKAKATAKGVRYSFMDMLHLLEGGYDLKRKGYYLYDYDKSRFTDTKPPIQQTIMNWVQRTLDHYSGLFQGNYVKGDPHRAFKDVVTYHAKPANVVVGLDASAGGSSSGKTANNLVEKTLSLSVAQSVRNYLESSSDKVKVVMTRTGDTTMTMSQRASRLKSQGANQIFGIAFSQGGEGVTVYVNAGASVGARTLQEKVAKLIEPVAEKHGVRFNGRRTGSSTLLKYLGSKSAIVISLGHLDNERDATRIKAGTFLEDMSKVIASAIVNVTNLDGNQASSSTAPATNTAFPDFFEKYKPQLSAEEKKYKMKFAAVEMELIRAGGETGGDLAAAEAYLEQFARYITHVLRARATGLTVECRHAMPSIRPGYNAWLEPTRRDRIFYVTGVRHTGSFRSGVQTYINGAYTRRTADYDTHFNDNLFVSVSNYKASDLMPVIKKSQMTGIRQKLKSLHTSSTVIETGQNAYLNSLYDGTESANRSIVQGEWNNEMTEQEIAAQITRHFADAPDCVKERAYDTYRAVRNAIDLYQEFKRG